jgi:hypothetical protein
LSNSLPDFVFAHELLLRAAGMVVQVLVVATSTWAHNQRGLFNPFSLSVDEHSSVTLD